MADAKDLARHLAQSHAKGHAIGFGRQLHQIGAVASLGHDHRRHRVGIQVRRHGTGAHAPGGNGPADAFGNPGMAGINIGQPFLFQHLDGPGQPSNQPDRRGIGIAPRPRAAQHVAEIEEGARQGCPIHRRQCPW